MSLKVQIILMSYNRPEYILEALNSIQKQTYKNIGLIVSDNSTTETVFNLLKKEKPEVKVIRRGQSLSMADHWNKIMSEVGGDVSADYYMMFHDDDVMLPTAIADLIAAAEKYPKASAFAGNAYVIRGSVQTQNLFNRNLNQNIVLQSIEQLGLRYFNTGLGVNPFPGYMYSQKVAQNLKFNPNEAGKHSDVTFLFKCFAIGDIVWLAKPTMNYRIHSSNDSVGVDILALSGLVKIYLRSAKAASSRYFANEFIVKNYLLWLKEQGLKKLYKKHPHRVKVILCFVVKFFVKHPQSLGSYAIRKLVC